MHAYVCVVPYPRRAFPAKELPSNHPAKPAFLCERRAQWSEDEFARTRMEDWVDERACRAANG
eukprot:3292756-Lingulodinium_polyedra.AAC.1